MKFCNTYRYIHMILSRPDILTEYYESWAILRDEDKNGMLPNMAGGKCYLNG